MARPADMWIAKPSRHPAKVLAIVGSLLAAVSVALPWLGDDELPLGFDDPEIALSSEFPFLVLFDFGGEGVAESVLSVGLVVLLLGVAGVALSIFGGLSPLRRICGFLVVVIAGLFTAQVIRFVLDIEEPGDFFFRQGIGVYVALVGGFLLLLAPSRGRSAAAGTGAAPGQTAVAAPAPVQPATRAEATPAPSPPEPAAGTGWSPTHVVPGGGMRSWTEPDPSAAEAATLDDGLPLELVESRGDWALVRAVNGWTGWVDGRQLQGRPPS
jgi:hypothetical protein